MATSPAPTQQPTTQQPDPNITLFGDKLRQLIETDVRGDVEPEKALQYAEARRNHLYLLGAQYIAYQGSFQNQGLVNFKPVVGGGMSPVSNEAEDEFYDYVMNIFYGDVQKFIGVLGVRAPNVKAQPDRRGDGALQRRARIADEAAAYLRSVWPLDEIQRELALSIACYGTSFLYTPWTADADRYGWTHEPRYEVRQRATGPATYECEQCGASMPADTAAQERCQTCGAMMGPENFREAPTIPGLEVVQSIPYARGSVELHLCNTFTVTTPFYVKDLGHCPWLWYEYEEHKGRILQTWPHLRQASGIDQQYSGVSGGVSVGSGQYSRDLASSTTGALPIARRNRWTLGRYWLDPVMYELIKGDETGNMREQLLQKFPRGLKLTMANREIAALEPGRIAEEWAACKPTAWLYLYPPPLFNPYIQANDILNDMITQIVELLERSSPITLYKTTLLDRDVIREQTRHSAEFLPVKPSFNEVVGDAFARIPPASPDPGMFSIIDTMKGMVREIVGIQPAIFGGPTPGDRTAREAELMRNQALQQLNIPYQQMTACHEQAYTNGAIQLARNCCDGIAYRPQGAAERAEEIKIEGLEELLKGGWHYEAEESMPMTAGQRRDSLQNMLTNPPAWPILGIGSPAGPNPDNVEDLQEAVGLIDWEVPGMLLKERLLAKLDEMSQGAPIQQPDGSTAASVELDDALFPPQQCIQIIQSYLLGRAGEDLERRNPEGFQNVLAALKMMLAKMQPSPPSPQPGQDGSQSNAAPTGGQEQPEQGLGAPPPGQEGTAAPPPNGGPPPPAIPPPPEVGAGPVQ